MAEKTMAELRFETKAKKFCRAMIFDGLRQIDAYRSVTPRHARYSADQLSKHATTFANRPLVKKIYIEMVRAATPHEMSSPGAIWNRLDQDHAWAKEQGNGNAVMMANRLAAQILGLVREGSNVNLVFNGSDEKIIEAIGRGDPERTALARKLLVPAGFAKPQGNA